MANNINTYISSNYILVIVGPIGIKHVLTLDYGKGWPFLIHNYLFLLAQKSLQVFSML